jgi:hypothetical protein
VVQYISRETAHEIATTHLTMHAGGEVHELDLADPDYMETRMLFNLMVAHRRVR